MKFKQHIPNGVTMLNLISGLIAMMYAFDENLKFAFIWVCIGIFFDFWDGFLARLLHVKSDLGLQLDSLADMVTSGVVPGLVMYKLISNIQANHPYYNLSAENHYLGIIPYIGFLITVASAYRLAKFNIDTRQTDSFVGLPTPANSLLILSLPLVQWQSGGGGVVFDLLNNMYVLIAITVLSSYLLVSEIRLFSLKMKTISWASSKLQILFLLYSLLILFLFEFSGIAIIIVSYIALSIILTKVFRYSF